MTDAEAIQLLLEGDRDERERAALLLRHRPFHVGLLVPVLEHPHVSRQVKAIEILRGAPSRDATELLLPMLASSNILVREKAASALGKAARRDADLVAAALDTAVTREHRLALCDALSRLQDPRGRETLIVLADSWEPSDRRLVLDYLRRYREDPPVETVRAALYDRETRVAAMDVAGRLRDPSFLPPLLDFLLEAELDFDLRWRLQRVISKFGVAAIDPLLGRDSFTVRDRIRSALDSIFNFLHAEHLPALAKHPDENVRERATSRLTALANRPR